MTDSLRDRFEELAPSEAEIAPGCILAAIPIDSAARCHLVRTPDLRPLLLIGEDENAARTPAIRLENLAIEHGVSCVVRSEGNERSGKFTLVHCLSRREALHYLFLDLLESKLFYPGADYSADTITETLGQLVDLFRAAARPPVRTAQGLWAELYVIRTGAGFCRCCAIVA